MMRMTDGGMLGGVRDRAEEVAAHPAAAWLAAAGHVVNGIVHAIIGAIAIGVARGAGGSADQTGAMRAIGGHPLGSIALWIVGLAMLWLGAYSVVLAVSDSRHDRRDAASSAGRALAFVVVGLAALTYATGGTADGEEATESVSTQLLQSWWGAALLVAGGIVIVAIGVSMMVRGITRSFLDEIAMPPRFRAQFTILGMVGYVAKGIAVAIVGILFVVAVVTRDPSNAGGLDGALKSLVAVSGGQLLLVAIAVGLILYGVFCVARARTPVWRRSR